MSKNYYSNSKSQIKKLDKNQANKLLEKIVSKNSDKKEEVAKTSFVDIPKNFTTGIIKNIHERSTDLIDSFKNTKLKNLELFLKIDRESRIKSSKKTAIYEMHEKTIIIDLDMWNEPVSVTVKTPSSVSLKTIKFLDNTPYLFPKFNEKNFFGQIIYLSKDEIWYNDSGTITSVKFFSDIPNVVKIKVDISKEFNYKDLLDNPTVMSQIKTYSFAQRNKRLLEFLEVRNISLDSVITLNKEFIISRSQNNRYQVLLLTYDYIVNDAFILYKLPFSDENALKLLFSKDLVEFVKSNKYSFEDFTRNGDFIEYWKYLGVNKVCLLRCKIEQ